MTMLPIHVAETPGTSTPPLRRSPEAVAEDVHHGENTTTKKRVLTKPSVVRRTSSATRLRSNLFYKLGLPPKEDTAAARVVSRASPGSLLRHAKVEHIPLSGNDEGDDNDTEPQDEGRDEHHGACRTGGTTDKVLHAMGALWSPLGRDSLTERSTTSASSSSSHDHDNQHDRHVHFCPQVSVIPIPTRHDYSNRIRGFLWPTATELQTNVLRNTLEFSADGWDWNGVLEEDGHYYNPATKEYIHPIHLEIAQMPFEEQQLLGVTDRYINPALAG